MIQPWLSLLALLNSSSLSLNPMALKISEIDVCDAFRPESAVRKAMSVPFLTLYQRVTRLSDRSYFKAAEQAVAFHLQGQLISARRHLDAGDPGKDRDRGQACAPLAHRLGLHPYSAP